MKVLAIYNIKGGVGKTAAAVNLACLSAREGARTLVWDLDPQAATTFYLRVKPRIKGGGKRLIRGKRPVESAIKGTDFPGFDVIPGDFSFRRLDRILDNSGKPTKLFSRILKRLARSYDHIFFDCPPGMSIVSETVFRAVGTLVVPIIPTPLSMRTLGQMEKYLDKVGVHDLRVLPFFSMVDRRKGLHREIASETAWGGYLLLRTQIPYASQVEQMGIRRAPVVAFAPQSPASVAFQELWAEIRSSLYS